jgi:DNA helicase-2/ATP-dependent DNA helicase PcrA
VPARGIGDQTIAKAREAAAQRRCTLMETLRRAADVPELKLAEERIAAFVALIDKYGPRLTQKGFSAAARDLCDEAGLHDEARRGAQSLPAQARKIEALESLLRQLVAFEQRAEEAAAERALSKAGPDEDDAFAAGLPGYLMKLALDSREAREDEGDAVTLMTLHGAKGLEWRAVFLCGLEEGLLPHSGKGFDDASGDPTATGALNLEEERRLCYVGITRARERLTLTRAAERTRRGKPEPRTPSRFLEDLPDELVDKLDLTVGSAPASSQDVQKAKAKNFFSAMDDLLGKG